MIIPPAGVAAVIKSHKNSQSDFSEAMIPLIKGLNTINLIYLQYINMRHFSVSFFFSPKTCHWAVCMYMRPLHIIYGIKQSVVPNMSLISRHLMLYSKSPYIADMFIVVSCIFFYPPLLGNVICIKVYITHSHCIILQRSPKCP